MRKFLHAEFRAAVDLNRVGVDGNCFPGEIVSETKGTYLLVPYIELEITKLDQPVKSRVESASLGGFIKGLENIKDKRFIGGKVHVTYPHELYEFTVDFLSKYGNDGFDVRYAQKTKEVVKSIGEADASKPEPTTSDGELCSEPQDTKTVWKRPLSKLGIGVVAALSAVATGVWLFIERPDQKNSTVNSIPSDSVVPPSTAEMRPVPEPQHEEPSLDVANLPVPRSTDEIGEPSNREPAHFGRMMVATDTIALSPDGRYIALSDDDWNISVYFAESGALAARFIGHEGPIRSLDFSANGDLLASGSTDHTARVWSIAQKRQVRKFRDGFAPSELHTHHTIVKFSPDGEFLAYAGAGRALTIRHVGSEVLQRTLVTHPPGQRHSEQESRLDRLRKQYEESCSENASLSPECARLNNRVIEAVNEVRSEERRKVYQLVPRPSDHIGIRAISFSSDGSQIATISTGLDSDLQIFDRESGEIVNKFNLFKQRKIYPVSLAYSPFDSSLYVVGYETVGTQQTKKIQSIMRIDRAEQSSFSVLYQTDFSVPAETPLDFSPNGRFIIHSTRYGFTVFDVDAQISIVNFSKQQCYSRHLALSGGSPLMIAADFCDGKGVTVQPLANLISR